MTDLRLAARRLLATPLFTVFAVLSLAIGVAVTTAVYSAVDSIFLRDAGARDPDVGKALTLLHNRPAHPWTVADLAREVGLSRTVLAERFRHFLGEPPMAYLTRWRLGLGARALMSTSHSVAQIAFDAGYESEAAFNRAFKREYGVPPARYRRDERARNGRIDRAVAV